MQRFFTSVQINGEELGQLEEREKQLQEKLETRKKQFHLLVSSIHLQPGFVAPGLSIKKRVIASDKVERLGLCPMNRRLP